MRSPDETRYRKAAAAVAARLRADRIIRREVVRLLAASGNLPSASTARGESWDAAVIRSTQSTTDRFISLLEGVIEYVLAYALEDADAARVANIRTFFLEPQETYSINELAALWQVASDDIRDIYSDALAEWARLHPDGTDDFRIAWADAVGASVTFNILRPFEIERALGWDFERVRPDAWRSIPILIHLPRFVAEAMSRDDEILPSNLRLAARVEQFILDMFTGDLSARAHR